MANSPQLLALPPANPAEAAQKIAAARRAAGLTQRALAERLGITLFNVTRLENGQLTPDQLPVQARAHLAEVLPAVVSDDPAPAPVSGPAAPAGGIAMRRRSLAAAQPSAGAMSDAPISRRTFTPRTPPAGPPARLDRPAARAVPVPPPVPGQSPMVERPAARAVPPPVPLEAPPAAGAAPPPPARVDQPVTAGGTPQPPAPAARVPAAPTPSERRKVLRRRYAPVPSPKPRRRLSGIPRLPLAIAGLVALLAVIGIASLLGGEEAPRTTTATGTVEPAPQATASPVTEAPATSQADLEEALAAQIAAASAEQEDAVRRRDAAERRARTAERRRRAAAGRAGRSAASPAPVATATPAPVAVTPQQPTQAPASRPQTKPQSGSQAQPQREPEPTSSEPGRTPPPEPVAP